MPNLYPNKKILYSGNRVYSLHKRSIFLLCPPTISDWGIFMLNYSKSISESHKFAYLPIIGIFVKNI